MNETISIGKSMNFIDFETHPMISCFLFQLISSRKESAKGTEQIRVPVWLCQMLVWQDGIPKIFLPILNQ